MLLTISMKSKGPHEDSYECSQNAPKLARSSFLPRQFFQEYMAGSEKLPPCRIAVTPMLWSSSTPSRRTTSGVMGLI